MKKKNSTQKQIQYVIPLGNGWVVKSSLAGKFLLFTDSKKEAVDMARSMAKHKKSELVVYSKQGKILSRKSYA